MGKKKSWRMLAAALFCVAAGVSSNAQDGDAVRGRSLYGEQCSLCHTDDGDRTLGSDLIGIFGSKVASTGFRYSAGLKASAWNWDEAALDHFLENPVAMVPDTLMPFSVPDRSERKDIIAYLKTLTRVPDPAGSVSRSRQAGAPPQD